MNTQVHAHTFPLSLSQTTNVHAELLNAWVKSGSIKERHLKAKCNVASGTPIHQFQTDHAPLKIFGISCS